MAGLEERGVVAEVRGATAVVRVTRSGACAGCAAAGGCRGAGAAERLVEAVNDAGARTGDGVVIEVAQGAVLHASFVVYAVPILGMLAVAGAAQLVVGACAPGAADRAAGLGGLLGAALGALVARRLARRRGPRAVAARIVRVD